MQLISEVKQFFGDAGFQPFGYTGYQKEEAGGLYYAQARRYDADTGRFVSEDKISGFAPAPHTLNCYNYCWNNSINYIDRNGKWPEWIDTSEEGAQEKIEENKENIIKAAEETGVDPALVALMIYTEQVHNYNIIDTLSDRICGFYGVDTSVGIGQVQISTAKEIEEMGYMPLTCSTEGGWKLPFGVFVHGTEQMAREKKLEDDYTNIRYVAAYVALIEDTWREEFPDIYNRPDIVWTLYNTGYHNRTPHSDPKPGNYGEFAAENYDLMKCLLEE